jgi:C4-dicarboxylate transporter DctQ subunit
MKSVTRIRDIFDRVNSVCVVVAVILLIYPVITISLDTVMRYVFNQPQKWVSETTEFCLPLITFLGTAWVLRKDGHVKMDVVLNQLSPRPLAVMRVITSILGVIICLALIWYGIRVTWEQFQLGYFSPLLEIPTGPLVAIVPAGGFLLLVQFVIRIFEEPRS